MTEKDNQELGDKLHDIIEGKTLIAEFMGKKEAIERTALLGGSGYGGCRYDSSWDWLFPVIDKINGLGKEYHLAIFKTYVSVSVEKGGKFYKDFSLAHSENISKEQTSLEAAYKVVVKFVKWYNKNLKQ